MPTLARIELARAGLKAFEQSDVVGCAWMKTQFDDVYAGFKRNKVTPQTLSGALQQVYSGPSSLKEIMFGLVGGKQNAPPGLAKCTLYSNDRVRYNEFERELAHRKRFKQRQGRLSVNAGLFVERITEMAETLLDRPLTTETAMAMLIPLCYALSCRLCELDETMRTQASGHVANPWRDFKLVPNGVVQFHGAKNHGEVRAPRRKCLLLDAELVKRMLKYVHLPGAFPSRDLLPSFTAVKYFHHRPRGSTHEESRFARIMREFGVDEAITLREEPNLHFNCIRSISLTLFPYVYDVSDCVASRVKSATWATCMQAGHEWDSTVTEQYTCNKVTNYESLQKKRARLLFNEEGYPVGVEADYAPAKTTSSSSSMSTF